jgi:hypothetical protein
MARGNRGPETQIRVSPLSTEERLARFDAATARQFERQQTRAPRQNEPLTQESVDAIYNDELRAYAQQVLDHPQWTPEQHAEALGSTLERVFILTQWLKRGWTRDELYERDRSR